MAKPSNPASMSIISTTVDSLGRDVGQRKPQSASLPSDAGGPVSNVVSLADRKVGPPSIQRLVVTEDEAAFMLGLAPRTLSTMRVEGGGPPFVKLSERRIGYAVSALVAWIERRSVTSTSEATAAKTATRR